ncbi:MAG: efflux RND transporter periplasmic adaptor subunit [Planctomycetota bacterium]|jgi:multidrug resistance efflux pump
MSYPDMGADERVGPRARRVASIVPIGVVLATICLLAWSAWPFLRPARRVMVAQAILERSGIDPSVESNPQAERVVRQVQAPGWLEAEPFSVACTALADGIVERIHVLEGDYIERGQVVAELVSEDSEIRLRQDEARLASAEAALGMARAEYRAAQQAWDEPIELERAVESSRAALDAMVGELAQLPSLIDSAAATLRARSEVAARVRHSVERGAANEIELIIAEQREASQRGEVEALRAREPMLEAHIRRLGAELRASERSLALRIEDRRRLDESIGAVARAEADVASARASRDEAALELERMVIRAPVSGYVQRRYKIPGDKVVRMMDDPESAHIVHLYDPSRLQVRVDVPLADASQISVGQACEVVVEVLPDRVFRGEVLRIMHEADLQKNTLQAKVGVLDPDPILRPEMLTRVVFLPAEGSTGALSDSAGSATRRVLVPAVAIDPAAMPARVWLVTDRRSNHGTLVPRLVEIVEETGDWLTVEGNIHPGALVAIGVIDPMEGESVVIRDSITDGGAR